MRPFIGQRSRVVIDWDSDQPFQSHQRERLRKFQTDTNAVSMGVPGEIGLDAIVATDFPELREKVKASAVFRVGAGFEPIENHATRSPPVTPPTESSPVFCIIADETHLGFLNGFIENLAHHLERDFALAVLALDDAAEEFVRRAYPSLTLRCFRFEELWSDAEREQMEGRSLRDRAFGSKARLMRAAIAFFGRPALYCDVDIFFFHSPRELFEELEPEGILLFPQWNDHLRHARRYGIYNAGMIGVGVDTVVFLDWWATLCLTHYSWKDRDYFVDQGFLDLVPTFFEGARVDRSRSHNVASWNVHTLGLIGLPAHVRRHRVRSFHAAEIDECGLYAFKFAWDQAAAAFADLPAAARDALVLPTLLQQRLYEPRAARMHFLLKARRTMGHSLAVRDLADYDSWTDGVAGRCLETGMTTFRRLRKLQHALTLRWEGRGDHDLAWLQTQRAVP